jgi:ABC-type dipeptide/oligopeptide/nickel transport system permease component
VIAYILQRALQSIFVLLLVSLLAFLILRLSGDPVSLLVEPNAPRELIEEARRKLGLDQPLHVQYMRFLADAVRGDLGTSIRYQSPTLPIALSRLPATIELSLTAMAMALLVGLPAGIVSAVKWNSRIDYGIRISAFLAQGVPFFWLAIMLILVFSVNLAWLPTSGRGTWTHLILPAVTLSLLPMARITRLLRASLLSVLREDYITVARAKGLTQSRMVMRHALKNALLPVVTDIALLFGALLSGAIIVETIFAWPGIGRLAIDSIGSRDYPMVQTLVMLSASIFVTLNLAADISYAVIDPRVRRR